MVAICVRSFGDKPVECNARQLLFKATAALERKSWIECGCCLREAVRVWLEAECRYFGCTPRTKKPAPPRELAKALVKAGELGPSLHAGIIDIVDIGNRAAHLSFVQPRELEAGIAMTHYYLDGSPYLVQPKAGGRV